jgi:hypothetical protein
MQQRRHARGAGDDGGGPREIGVDHPARQPQQIAVPVAVHRDGVAGGHELGGQGRRARHLLAEEEERGPRPRGGERLEHRGRAERIRPVVERDRHAARGGRPRRDAQRRGQRRHDRRERGQRPAGGDRAYDRDGVHAASSSTASAAVGRLA